MLVLDYHDDVALITLDDGKANVVSEAFSAAVNEALDETAARARATVIAGRAGCFCGGFDLKVVRAGGPPAQAMREAGARLLARLFAFPGPVVMACTGHALAAGGLLLLSGDTRVGAQGDFKIGLNETAIGLALPAYAVALCQARMPVQAWTQSVIQARLHNPQTAIDAGFLDELVEPGRVVETALRRGASLAAMDGDAYATIKRRMRGAAAKQMLDSI